MSKQQESSRRWWLLLPLVLGVGIAAFLISRRDALSKQPVEETATLLRVIRVPAVDVVPRVWGYGTAEPGQVWKAVAEVQGRVIEIHSELTPGSLVQKGQELLSVDPTEYELIVAQLKADIESVQVQMAELNVNEQNYRESLKIEQSALVLAERELERLRKLSRSDTITEADRDATERDLLAQRQKVQAQQNTLNLLPTQQKTLNAELAVKQSKLTQAEWDLSKTKIVAPFNCSLADVDIEIGQFLSKGQTLFEAYSTAVTEIEAQVVMDQARKLVSPDLADFSPFAMDMESIRKLLNIEATVFLQSGDFRTQWQARFVGLREQIEPTTRSVSMVVAVDDPYQKAIPGKRPALVKGMFCEVELRSSPRKDKLVIPRVARYGDAVYVVNAENRLQRREVTVEFAQAIFLCLKSGLKAGDRLVVSDPTPAIEGMLVNPVEDDTVLQDLIAEASGEGSLK